MIPFPQAQKTVLSRARSYGTEEVPLDLADGRILAEPILADRDYPPFNRSMMDGYAIQLCDWEQGIRHYQILETIFAGQQSNRTLRSGQCYKIMTGAAVPEPANVVIRREDATEEDYHVELRASSLLPFHNIARRGEDAKQSELLLSTPTTCGPAVISLLATLGKHRVKVMKLPTVALITTGNEIKPPQEPVTEFQIRNANQYLLRSLLKKHLITPDLCQHVPDDTDLLTESLRDALKTDIVIINGGVSAGDADHVPSVLEHLGVKKIFHKVSMRPGKPLWFGETKEGTVVFALPGNPLSCLTAFAVFIAPYLRNCLGIFDQTMISYGIDQARQKKSSLTEFFPVSRTDGDYVQLNPVNSSGDITAALHACGLGVQHADIPEIKAGERIEIFTF